MTSTLPVSAVTDLVPFTDPLRIPPLLRAPADGALVTVSARPVWVRLHSSLPRTLVWAYEGSFPGPTIEVRRGQRLRVAWRSDLSGNYPLVAVRVPNSTPPPTDRPGREGAEPIPEVAALPPWTVVHLHGARTDGGSDGWPEDGISRGGSQLAEYPNDQAATALWYHDHAMDITAFNVMTGLAGMYLIRDAEEDALRLPSGANEVPLVIADRNLDTDPTGGLTGQLLHKVVQVSADPPATLPFTGPFTLVNGVIWPYLEVEPRWYRFRVLNASNSRVFRLALVDRNGAPVTGAAYQIGTDSGLLPAPVPVNQLTLAPAERADLLIDFSAQRGKALRLVNTLDPAPVPDVMQFRVGAFPVWDFFTLPSRTSPSFTRITHDNLPAHGHRWVALTAPGPQSPHPQMWELREIEDASATTEPTVTVTDSGGVTRVFERVSTSFDGTLNFHVDAGAWEVWNFLNLGGPVHPMHIHLIRFQALHRHAYTVNTTTDSGGVTRVTATYSGAGTLDPNEQGWKDTIRVAAGELVSVAGQFSGGTGRYVYHCHLLEHEDEGMMRPFVVMPAQVMAVHPHEEDHDH
ncbi:multicopper oxidase family protein [Actinoplanes teichomyceticus]|uniref:Spore coat protein A n=1 Tax=Actinoplanes teichomyceticus TaxID=1867 RepID=A0A561VCQ2_ACTTI|nr:multicopper oxidase domain-containing protein [Actinoplanes teichomyceticus]TWG09390.1 spore coat protein A [Actinoplanes teichomyceticus]GIF17027.1 multicopper oxidase [Actinoplanes teichomyceticus]